MSFDTKESALRSCRRWVGMASMHHLVSCSESMIRASSLSLVTAQGRTTSRRKPATNPVPERYRLCLPLSALSVASVNRGLRQSHPAA